MSDQQPRTDFVFDLAGVLVEWDPLSVYLEMYGGDRDRAQEFLDNVLGESSQREISAGRDMEEVLAERAKAFPDEREAIYAWRGRWQEMLRGENAGAVAVLEELRERGYRTFALGNWSREEFQWARPRFDFLDDFDGVLLSGDCGVLKPDAAIFRRAQEQFGVQPTQTVFIDDDPVNAQAAVTQGWNGLVFENARRLYLVLMDYGYL